jgi:hypothetical protein
MAIFLPETSRNIVGDGSTAPPKYLRLPVPRIMRHWKDTEIVQSPKWRIPNPLKSLTILFQKDNAVIILACGLLYVVYTAINASLSTLFVEIYKLNQLQAGLIYLPFGLGGVLSAFISGRVLDRAWRNARTTLGLPTDKSLGDDLDNFPIERSRLRVVWIPMLVTTLTVITFGWVLHYRKVSIPERLLYHGPCEDLLFLAYCDTTCSSIHRRALHAT